MSYGGAPEATRLAKYAWPLRERERVFYSAYNRQDGVASTDPANMRAPWAEATPSVQGVRHSGVDE